MNSLNQKDLERILDKLEIDGLIESKVNEHGDVYYAITTKGKEVYENVKASKESKYLH